MTKFRGKYRITSTRLKNWDYGRNAIYFVTICTKNRQHFFGEIMDRKMNLSEIGIIVELEWLKTFDMRPDMNLYMGEYIIMPNHFHAIIGIGDNKYNIPSTSCRDAMHCVSTTNTETKTNDVITTNNATNTDYKNQFGPQSKNLSSIIRGFKIGVTKNARMIQPDFQWQPRFYDHIVRNDQSFHRISNYITNNPKQWDQDEFNI